MNGGYEVAGISIRGNSAACPSQVKGEGGEKQKDVQLIGANRTGVFLAEPVKAGQLLWRYDSRIDRIYSKAEVLSLPAIMQRYIETYSTWHDGLKLWILCGDNGRHFNFTQLINISHPIGKKVTVYGELYSALGTDKHTPAVYTLDGAAAYALTENLQLDVGANIGLNKNAPNLQVYTGLAQRF